MRSMRLTTNDQFNLRTPIMLGRLAYHLSIRYGRTPHRSSRSRNECCLERLAVVQRIRHNDEHDIQQGSSLNVDLVLQWRYGRSHLPILQLHVLLIVLFLFICIFGRQSVQHDRFPLSLTSSGVLSIGFSFCSPCYLESGYREIKRGCCMKQGTQQFGPGLHELSDLGIQVNENRHVFGLLVHMSVQFLAKMVQVKIERG